MGQAASLPNESPLAKGHIRLLQLEPGVLGAPVSVQLLRYKLGTPETPPYEALSYVWGTQLCPNQILVTKHCNTDSDWQQRQTCKVRVSITFNLDVALRMLRSTTQPRLLWIDSLCIDQGNDVEKASQVAQMGQIYAHATQVVISVGEERPKDAILFRIFEESYRLRMNPVVLVSKAEIASRPAALERCLPRDLKDRIRFAQVHSEVYRELVSLRAKILDSEIPIYRIDDVRYVLFKDLIWDARDNECFGIWISGTDEMKEVGEDLVQWRAQFNPRPDTSGEAEGFPFPSAADDLSLIHI